MIPARLSLAAVFALLATQASAMSLKSSDVAEATYFPQTEICARYGGHDISPALSWISAPATTKSFAVTMYDPDARGGWWHWLVVNIPPGTTALTQGAGSGKAELPPGALEAANSNGVNAYSGPCPPAASGTHHYQITLWALDSAKAFINSAGDPQAVGEWLQKHAIGMTRITPVYRK